MGGRSGTGLGLTVVWNTMQDHGGTIQVNSSPAGTVFTLYFPAADAPPATAGVEGQSEKLQGSGEEILIVDDEPHQRDVAGAMLTRMGYKVVSVASGEEALEYLRKHRVNLVVLDMIMQPGMNGLAAFQQILRVHPGQKAIIVSGFSASDDVVAAQKLGAGRYLKKPFTYTQLGVAVRTALHRE